MTCVIVQFEQRRAEILVDTLAGNHTRPIAWANKAVVFQAQHMALIIRGPNQCRRHAYDELDQTYLRRGIDGAFEPLAELLAQRQDDMFTTYLGAPENFLDCHAYIVGWSPSAKSFTAWRLLSSPTFEPEQLPHGLHAAPGPGCDTYFKASIFLVENLVEVAKIQKQGAVEQDGRQTISGYLIHIVMTTQEITMRKVLRFPDFDRMAEEMAK